MSSRTSFLVLLVFFALSACDSSPGSDEDARILDIGNIPDRTLGMRDTLVVRLSDFFALQSGAIEYTATAEPPNVDLEVDGNELELVPNASGQTTVLVAADAPGATSVNKSFSVTVLCPIVKGNDEADYMPVESGSSWEYDYARSEFDANDPDFSDRTLSWEGILTWRITGFTMDCNTASVEITETFEGAYTERDHTTDEILFTEQRTWTELYDAAYDGDLFVFEALLEPFGGTFRRFRAKNSEAVIALERIETDASRVTYYSVLFERGVGLTQIFNSANGDDFLSTTEMTLIR